MLRLVEVLNAKTTISSEAGHVLQDVSDYHEENHLAGVVIAEEFNAGLIFVC